MAYVVPTYTMSTPFTLPADSHPAGIVLDASGNLYVSDSHADCIDKFAPDGTRSVFVTTESLALDSPAGLLLNPATHTFTVAEGGSNEISLISSTGTVSRLAGGALGQSDGTGSSASFWHPFGLVQDASGNLYVSEPSNNALRKLTPAGIVTTLIGNNGGGFTDGPTSVASLSEPRGLATDALGNLYVADMGNGALRKITPAGVVSTIATGLVKPAAVLVTAKGWIYLTSQARVDVITPDGKMTTIAGGTSGVGNDDFASVEYLMGMAYDEASGKLYLSDMFGSRIRLLTPSK